MIDIESQVFRAVLFAVTPALTEMGVQNVQNHVANEYVKGPAFFPHVSVVETNNVSDTDTQTSSCGENFAAVTYEVNVYSNKQIGRKRECKSLMAIIDEVMLDHGFTRVSLENVPNLLDATVYRMVGRYTALVSRDEILYRR